MAHVYNSQLDAYTLYHKTHEYSNTSSIGPALPALGHALAGSTGTAISNLCIYPLDLIITRLQVQRSLASSSPGASSNTEYEGVIDAFIKIYEREGLAGFYTGLLQDTGKSIADSFLFFLFYNYVRSSRMKKYGSNTTTLPVVDELLVGMVAGAGSKFLTAPISNIVTRKQTSSMYRTSTSSSAEPSVRDIAEKIRSEKGIQGFWSGYSASLVLTLNPSLTFFLYEFFKRTLLPRARRDDPGARVTFLMAAMSKSIASTITYPFSLAKARAQASSKAPVNPSSASEIKSEIKSTDSTADAEKTATNAKNVAKRSTVFHNILEIYRSEGPATLYEGIWGEILKGFFSHGITMLVKERVHGLIISTYYLILRLLQKYPSPTELASQASSAAQEMASQATSAAQSASTSISEKASDVAQATKLGATNATESAQKAYESSKVAISSAAGKVGVIGNDTVEAGKVANDYASKEAGHLLGNAREMLGGQIEEVGKTIKPNEET